MISKIKKLIRELDAIALGAVFAVIPLIGDLAWWHRDYILGEWTWHLPFIAFMFSFSLVGSIVAMIWYHRSKDQQTNALQAQIDQLKVNLDHETQLVRRLFVRINELEEKTD